MEVTKRRGIIEWLSQQPNAKKHLGHVHPFCACLIHYSVTAVVVVSIHDNVFRRFVSHDDDKVDGSALTTIMTTICGYEHATLIFWYLVGLYGIRLSASSRTIAVVLYESAWLCNTTLFFGAFALRTGRPLIATSFCVAVSIDQVLWYVDLLGYFVSGFRKFPVGVAQYLSWPTTGWSTKITCTHHLWTIPLLIHGSRRLDLASIPFSFIIVFDHVLLSRWLTPFSLTETDRVGNTNPKKKLHYLNVNLSHEVWKDITFSFLQIEHDNPKTTTYLFRLLMRWTLLNFIVFIFVLYPISCIFFNTLA